MERIEALIDKLYQQKQLKSNPAQLLFTVQLLQNELLKFQQKNGTLGTAKVAVTLPVNMNFAEEEIRTSQPENKIEEAPVAQAAPVAERKPEPLPQSHSRFVPQAEPEPQPSYTNYKPLEETVSPYAPQQQVLNPAFSSNVEAPTLMQHQPKKEIHEVIGEKKESLNDKLKQEKTEVVHVLKDSPIKDLRKGIGINDRFHFVNELFRGDDAMYERSIKTINGFHILSEAEYWINRELKFKLGWNDSKDTVQHFYQLVRRRFS
jgi:hypothetical protein